MKIVDNKKEFSVKEFLNGKVIYFEGSNFFLTPHIPYIVLSNRYPDKIIYFECKSTNNKYRINLYNDTIKLIIDNKRYNITIDNFEIFVDFIKCLYFYVNNLSVLVNNQISFERSIKKIIHGKSSNK